MSIRRSTLDEEEELPDPKESEFEISKNYGQFSETLLFHKLEDFDNLMNQSQIYSSDFGKV